MAKDKKNKVEVETDEATTDEAVEDLDELEALADTAEPEATTDDEDEATDEEDTSKKSKKSKKDKAKDKGKKKKESDTYGTAELAEDLETDGKNLRVMLRDIGANKPRGEGKGSFNEAGRYEWVDLADALKTLGFKTKEKAIAALKDARDTRLNVLKERNAEKKAEKAKEKGEDGKKDKKSKKDKKKNKS